jgi:hypothetical protein
MWIYICNTVRLLTEPEEITPRSSDDNRWTRHQSSVYLGYMQRNLFASCGTCIFPSETTPHIPFSTYFWKAPTSDPSSNHFCVLVPVKMHMWGSNDATRRRVCIGKNLDLSILLLVHLNTNKMYIDLYWRRGLAIYRALIAPCNRISHASSSLAAQNHIERYRHSFEKHRSSLIRLPARIFRSCKEANVKTGS